MAYFLFHCIQNQKSVRHNMNPRFFLNLLCRSCQGETDSQFLVLLDTQRNTFSVCYSTLAWECSNFGALTLNCERCFQFPITYIRFLRFTLMSSFITHFPCALYCTCLIDHTCTMLSVLYALRHYRKPQ